MEAVKALPTNFPESEIAVIVRRINPKLSGQIKSIFVVLSDDMYRRIRFRQSSTQNSTEVAQSSSTNTNTSQSTEISESGNSDPPERESRSTSGPKSHKRGASVDGGAPSKR